MESPQRDHGPTRSFDWVEGSDELLLIVAHDGRIERMNASAREALGLADASNAALSIGNLVEPKSQLVALRLAAHPPAAEQRARTVLEFMRQDHVVVRATGRASAVADPVGRQRLLLALRLDSEDTSDSRRSIAHEDILRSLARAQSDYLDDGDSRAAMSRALRHSMLAAQSAYGFVATLHGSAMRAVARCGLRESSTPDNSDLASCSELAFAAQAAGGLLVVDDAASDPRALALPQGEAPLRNFLVASICKGGRVCGVLCLGNRDGGFARFESSLLQAILQTTTWMLDACLHERHEAELEERRRSAEREMRMAQETLDATDDAALVFDASTLRFVYANEGAMRQLGYSREELLSRTPLDVAPRLTESDLRANLAAIERNGGRGKNQITLHRGKDGREFPVEVSIRLMASEGGPARFVAVARDITERRQAERIALRSQRLEAIGTLAGGVAHDLNNAMAPILMAVDGLRRSAPSEQHVLDILECCAKRAAHMVRSLLSFAKGAEGSRLPLAPQRLIEEVAAIARSTFPKNIHIESAIAPGLPQVLGDATQLHQVLLNLALNARDAMPTGGMLKFEADLHSIDADAARAIPDARPGDYVRLRVIDSGAGIPSAVLDRIFEPFFTTKGPDKGTGLGLSSALGIVKGHSGFVHVSSKPGQGSQFTVCLPIAKEEAPVVALPQEKPVGATRKKTVLLVDDEPTIRRITEIVFRRLGVDVIACANGAEAIARVEHDRDLIDGVVTDLNMPDMDGADLIAALRDRDAGLRIAAVSGRPDDALGERLRSLGVEHMLHKPFTQGEVGAFLTAFLAAS